MIATSLAAGGVSTALTGSLIFHLLKQNMTSHRLRERVSRNKQNREATEFCGVLLSPPPATYQCFPLFPAKFLPLLDFRCNVKFFEGNKQQNTQGEPTTDMWQCDFFESHYGLPIEKTISLHDFPWFSLIFRWFSSPSVMEKHVESDPVMMWRCGHNTTVGLGRHQREIGTITKPGPLVGNGPGRDDGNRACWTNRGYLWLLRTISCAELGNGSMQLLISFWFPGQRQTTEVVFNDRI